MQYPMYWAVGLACFFALAVIGGSGFLTWRLYQAEARRLQEQFAAMLHELAAQADTKIERTQAAQRAEMHDLLRLHVEQVGQQLLNIRADVEQGRAGDRQQVQQLVQRQLDELGANAREWLRAHDARMEQERLALRAEFAALRPEVQQLLKAQDEATRKDFAGTQRDVATLWDAHHSHEKAYVRNRTEVADKLKELARAVQSAEAVARQVEESFWDVRHVPVNVLRSQFLGLQAAVDAGEKVRVEMVLARILKALGSLRASGQRCDTWTLDRLRETVGLAAKMAPAAAKEILALLESLADEAHA